MPSFGTQWHLHLKSPHPYYSTHTPTTKKNRNVNEYRYSHYHQKEYRLALTSRWLSFWHFDLDNVQKYYWPTKPLADENTIKTCARSISWFLLKNTFFLLIHVVFQNKAIVDGITITLIDVWRRRKEKFHSIRQIVAWDFLYWIK